MILLIDNYDSFVYNLYQFIAQIDPDVRIVRNDRITLEEVSEMRPDLIVLSPELLLRQLRQGYLTIDLAVFHKFLVRAGADLSALVKDDYLIGGHSGCQCAGQR